MSKVFSSAVFDQVMLDWTGAVAGSPS